ncbi:MAG TPA: hypothetical protein VF876_02115 [Burkholderiales bacterium]
MNPDRAMVAVSARRLARAVMLLLAGLLGGCGGGGDEGTGAGSGSNSVAVYVETPPADATADTATAQLTGGAACPDCPPTEWAFGYCPAGPPFIPSSAVTVSWANRLTGASGAAFSGISGSCSCLFSYCSYSYSRRWSALVPLAYGANTIVVTASDSSGGSGTASRTVTRVPPAPSGVTAQGGQGQATVSWSSVPDATAYNVYWSTSRTLTKENGTRIANVASPHVHAGLADDVTHFYLVTAEVSGLESAGSPVAWATTGWVTERVAGTTATTLERDAAIALDAAGNPLLHFSYDEKVGSASLQYNVYAAKAAGAWTAVPVDTPLAVNAGIGVDSGGTVHVSYLDFGGLTHAVYASGAWNAEIVDATASCGAAFALDAGGRVHLAYRASVGGANELRYATNASGTWVVGTVTAFSTAGCSMSGRRIAISVDGGGVVHIAFAGDYPDYGLKYATRQAGAWSAIGLDQYDIQQLAAQADANGVVHVAYADNAGRLRYASNSGGAWNVGDIEPQGSPAYPSLALDAGGLPHVSYFYPGLGELRHAKRVAGAWQVSVIADAGTPPPNGGSDTAIAVDAFGKARIGYFDNRSGDLHYAKNGP